MLRQGEIGNLECSWNVLLPIVNTDQEFNRIKKINPRISRSVYPLTREYLNNYFNTSGFDIRNFQQTFYPDCAASMYSYWLMTYGFTPGEGGVKGSAAPAIPGGQGISFGLNPFFSLFNLDSPILWIILLALGIIVVKKVMD